MAHVHALCSRVSGHVASSAGVASAAVTAVAVVQGPIRPADPQLQCYMIVASVLWMKTAPGGGHRPFLFLKFYKGKRDGY